MKNSPANPQAPFTVTPYHRNVPEAALLADLRRVAGELKTKTLSASAYDDRGQFSSQTFAKRFGGWAAALALVKLKPSHCFHVTEKMMIRDIRRVARRCKTERLLSSDYSTHGKYSLPLARRLFKNWTRATEAAGLAPCRYRPLNDQDLLDNLQKIWETLGRQPKQTDVKAPLSKFSMQCYSHRYGNFRKALLAFEQSKLPPGIITAPNLWQPRPCARKRKTSRHVNWRLRFKILQRDNFRCVACGRSPVTHPGTTLQIDHTLPWRLGG